MYLTYILIIITCIISYLAFQSQSIMSKLIFSPYTVQKNKEYYRFLSSGLVHASWQHLIFNMITLYSFGVITENYYRATFGEYGNILFLLLYLGSMFFADLSTYYKHKNNPYYASLGASGATCAVLIAAILFDPLQRIIFPFPMPAFLFAIIFMAYSFYAGKQTPKYDNTNHEAHFYGGLFGLLFTILLSPSVVKNFFNHFF